MTIKITNNKVVVRSFEEKDITKKFVDSLNNKKINQFLYLRKKKQTFKSALKYFQFMNKNKYYYFSVIDKYKKKFIGTITFRPITKKTCQLGLMISNKNYFGSNLFYDAINDIISYMMYQKHYTKIISIVEKKNLASSFNSLKIGCKISKKTFFFELKKKDFKKRTKFKFYEKN